MCEVNILCCTCLLAGTGVTGEGVLLLLTLREGTVGFAGKDTGAPGVAEQPELPSENRGVHRLVLSSRHVFGVFCLDWEGFTHI